MRKKALLFACGILAALALSVANCGSDSGTTDGGGTDGGATDGGGGVTSSWSLTVEVDLGGKFPVEGTLDLSTSGSGYTAKVKTTKIGGAAEAHDINLSGTFSGKDYTIKDQKFDIEIKGGGSTPTKESITVNGSFKVDGDRISGSGTCSVDQGGGK